MEEKIAATLICGNVAHESLVRCLDSLLPHVDRVFIAYNGTAPFPLDRDEQLHYRVEWGQFEWRDDFASMRQLSIKMVPPDRYRWMLWIDTDDTLEMEHEGSLVELLDSLDANTQQVFLRYDYLVEPETGMVLIQHWR